MLTLIFAMLIGRSQLVQPVKYIIIWLNVRRCVVGICKSHPTTRLFAYLIRYIWQQWDFIL